MLQNERGGLTARDDSRKNVYLHIRMHRWVLVVKRRHFLPQTFSFIFHECAREIQVASGVTYIIPEKRSRVLSELCAQFFISCRIARAHYGGILPSSKRMDEHLSAASCCIVNSWCKACQSRWLHQVLLALLQRARLQVNCNSQLNNKIC